MSYWPTITEIENAFIPAQEITDAERFAGRQTQVRDAYYGLLAKGANIAILGNRGIGKTSLGRQVINMASGDNQLLKRLGIPADGKLDFLCVYFACGGVTRNYKDLLEKLLTTKECLADWIYDIPTARTAIGSLAPKFSIGFAGASIGLDASKQTEVTTSPALTEHDVDTIFTNVLSSMIKARIVTGGILIVVDEFDRIDELRGLAPFLKSLATNVPGVKFCLVGVAQDIQTLMKEHESTDRLFAGSIIELPSMTPAELTEIVRIAEKSIQSAIVFDNTATDELVRLAQGHPYMVHLIGKYALRSAFLSKKAAVASEDVMAALKDIATRAADPVLESRYKKAIASSPQRETVLRAMAATHRDGEVHTTDAYKIALDQGVDNASQYVGNLVVDEYGAEIVKVRERYYRFKDSLFHAYVSARPPVFQV